MGDIFIFLGLLVFAAHLFAMLFSKRKIPDVLWLLIIGVIIGPVLGLVSTTDLGKVGPVFSSLTLVVILFEGGLDISIKSLLESWKPTLSISLTCFVLSVIIVALFGIYLLHMPFLSALTFGAVLGGTSSAVVIPLVKHLKLGQQTRLVLVLESAVTDVLCIVLTLALVQSFQHGSVNVPKIFGNILASFTMAAFIGIMGGVLWSSVLEKIRKIQNSIFLTPAFVFVLYGLSEMLSFSGAITALAFGITIANVEYFRFPWLKFLQKRDMMKLAPVEISFISELVFLLKTVFFVYIGISIPFHDVKYMLYGGLITLALFIGRLIVSKFTTSNQANSYDKTILSMMIPKGLAAAVLASIPEQAGMPYGTEIKLITYSIVFISILLTSVMILVVERSVMIDWIYRRYFNFRHRNFSKGISENLFTKKKVSEEDDQDDDDSIVGNS